MLLGGGVGARLIPLLRDPRDGGVFGELLSGDQQLPEEEILTFPSSPTIPLHP